MAGKVVVGVGIGVELNSSWKGKKELYKNGALILIKIINMF